MTKKKCNIYEYISCKDDKMLYHKNRVASTICISIKSFIKSQKSKFFQTKIYTPKNNDNNNSFLPILHNQFFSLYNFFLRKKAFFESQKLIYFIFFKDQQVFHHFVSTLSPRNQSYPSI